MPECFRLLLCQLLPKPKPSNKIPSGAGTQLRHSDASTGIPPPATTSVGVPVPCPASQEPQ